MRCLPVYHCLGRDSLFKYCVFSSTLCFYRPPALSWRKKLTTNIEKIHSNLTSKMLHGVNHSACIYMQLPKAATRLRSFEIYKNRARHCRKKLCTFSFESTSACYLCEPWRPGPGGHICIMRTLMLWLSCWAEVILFSNLSRAGRERRGGGGSEMEQIELTSGVNFVFSSISDRTIWWWWRWWWWYLFKGFPIYRQRWDKQDSNISRSASERRVTHSSVSKSYLDLLESKLGFSHMSIFSQLLSAELAVAREQRPMASSKSA